MQTLRSWKWSPICCHLNSTWTGQYPVSVRHSVSAFKEVVDLRLNYSSPGSPFSEHNDYHCDDGTSDSFPSFPETHLGNSLAPLVPG